MATKPKKKTKAEKALKLVIYEAQCMVDLFDQANTGGAIRNLGSRGKLAADQANDLRAALVKNGTPPILEETIE